MASKIKPLSGFPEFLPEQQVVVDHVVETIRDVFELHGFGGLTTRAVEPLEQLLRKGETSKEVYVLRRLHETDSAADSGMGLHFDLTVPFARYVVENAGKLNFPLRRHQIQPVWRGERPQEGRYREFWQADIDIVGRDTLGFWHDVEVITVMANALRSLDFLPAFTMQVNNRKVITAAYASFGIADPEATMRVVDKLDKLPPAKVRELLVSEAGCTDAQAHSVLALAEIRGSDPVVLDAIAELCPDTSDLLLEGIAELREVLRATAAVNSARLRIEVNLSIARGLDYYTGTVIETRLTGYEHLGSICSGGRYDSLATDGRSTFPGVGVSFGLSRTLVPLLASGAVRADRGIPSVVLVALNDAESRPRAEQLAALLRTRDIACETAPQAAKLGKQIKYAERRGIPFVWFPQGAEGGGDAVKDIRTGYQVDASAETWEPPLGDLTPSVTAHDPAL